MPFIMAWKKHEVNEVVSDHSSHGMRSNGTPNIKARSMKLHLKKRGKDCVSCSTSFHQSYKRHTRRRPYTPKVYMRWLGASMSVTGITGVLDTTTGGAFSGRFGRGDLTFGGFWEELRRSGFCRSLPGVEGHEDRRRGVPFMACSPRSLRTLCGRGDASRMGASMGQEQYTVRFVGVKGGGHNLSKQERC